MKKQILGKALFAFLLLALSAPAGAAQKKNFEGELNKLKASLKSDGYDTSAFSDPRFRIYEDLNNLRRKEGKLDYLGEEFGYYTEESFEAGRNFINSYSDVLDAAEKDWGVGKEYIAAIMKMESNFGKRTGTRYLLNTFSSMYVLTERKKLAINEMKVLLSGKIDPFLKGSYGGAFGDCQSIPSSWAMYSVDFDLDGIKNPYDMEDAIAFVANYLHSNDFENSAEKAIFAYNHDDKYVEAIMAYAGKMGKRKAEQKKEIASAGLLDLNGERIEFQRKLRFQKDNAE
ncbi:MAG: lytic murein transglycosylase [Candidatus Paceibacterota bacterium]